MTTRAESRLPRSGLVLAMVERTLRDVRQPVVALSIVLVLVLGVLVVAPLVRLVAVTTSPEGIAAWRDVLASPLSENLFWEPLANSIALGLVVGIGAILLGGGLAWLVVLTDVPGRRIIGLLASVPFVLPSFAIALAWESIFRDDRIGGRTGWLWAAGVPVPDWLAWGFVPIAVTLLVHYFSLAFMLIAAALASVNAELTEAGEMTGASRGRVALGVTFPIVLPAIVAAGLLAFAEAISNFAAPALLGLPVRFHTLSTRLYGSISTGQVERGYVLAILLIVLAGVVLFIASRRIGGRRSYATITGKGGRARRLALGRWRWPAAAIAISIGIATTVIPGLALLASSLTRRTGSLAGGLTDHFWLGASDPSIAQGQAGVLRNPRILEAAGTTIALGLAVALAASILGLAIGYVVGRGRGRRIASLVGGLSYLPFLIPGIAFGAVYIALLGRPIGPLPALYGTFALLVIAGAAYTLPFAAQSGRAANGQVAPDLEEAATMAGAGLPRRLAAIIMPLTVRAMIAGAVLVFVKMVRDLSLVVLLVTPATPLLSVVTFRYASEGFAQFANAITVIIAAISVGATLLARRLQGATQPWMDR